MRVNFNLSLAKGSHISSSKCPLQVYCMGLYLLGQGQLLGAFWVVVIGAFAFAFVLCVSCGFVLVLLLRGDSQTVGTSLILTLLERQNLLFSKIATYTWKLKELLKLKESSVKLKESDNGHQWVKPRAPSEFYIDNPCPRFSSNWERKLHPFRERL